VTKYKVEPESVEEALELLRACGYPHVIARSRSDLVTLTTAGAEPWPLARFRRVAVSLWTLEMPTHTNRWERTPYRATLDALVSKLVIEFPWTIEEAREHPVRT
jgi:hypothetical protein